MPCRIRIFFFLIFCGAVANAQSDAERCDKLIGQGYDYLFRFMSAESREKFRQAVEIAKTIPDEGRYAEALLGSGQATWYLYNFKNAADTVSLALQHFPRSRRINIIGALRILSNIYDDMGDYANAFKAVQEALLMNKDADKQNMILSLVQMGKLYKNIGDYETARIYYAKAEALRPAIGEYPFREMNHSIGELYIAKGLTDSANYFYRRAFIGNTKSRIIRLRIGESFVMQKKADSALFYLVPLYQETEHSLDFNTMIGCMIGLGKVAYFRGEIKEAIDWISRASDIADEKGVFRSRREASQLLAALYDSVGQPKLALHYYKINAALKDSASSDVNRGQLFAFRQKTLEAEQAAAMRDLESQKKLAQRSILIVALLAVFIIMLLVLRHNNEKLRLKQRASELEMQALRAQMNPHFIFNCLSAINHFILNNEPEKASDYLTRFSRLMRLLLLNAGKQSISLEEELDMLSLYLDMEQLRFKDAFDYSIDLGPGIDVSRLSVPCFILQPFCENAIWHGLLHKEGKGHLLLKLSLTKGVLKVFILDNGIGMKRSEELKATKRESMGQKLTAARLALFNKEKKATQHFSIRELKDAEGKPAGTEVILKIKTSVKND